MTRNKKGVQWLFAAFVLVNSLLFFTKNYLSAHQVDFFVLMVANLVLFGITLIVVLLSLNKVGAKNPNAFTQGMYLGMIIKLFGCATAAFIYIYMNDGKVNKPAILLCVPLYIIYTTLETYILRRALKENTNG